MGANEPGVLDELARAQEAANAPGGDSKGDPASPFPEEKQRPCYTILDDWAEFQGRKYRPGVYICGMTPARKDTAAVPFETWLCSPLHIDAVTSDGQDNNFGRLLRFMKFLGPLAGMGNADGAAPRQRRR